MFKKLLGCLLLAASFQLQAGVLIEPYVGYSMLKHSGKIDNMGMGKLDVPTDKSNGMGFGGRLGWGSGPFGLALDYSAANHSEKGDMDGDASFSNLGLTAMVGIPFFRFWAGYIFKSTYEYEPKEGDDQTGQKLKGEEEGNGFKLGIGVSPLPLLSINLEYISLKYNKADYPNAFDDTSRTTNGVMLSVSLPLVF